MDTTYCPECGQVAEVQWRAVMESTDGPVEHCKVLCLGRHSLLLPTAVLADSAGQRAGAAIPGDVTPVPQAGT